MMENVGTPDPDRGDESALTWERAVAEFEAATPGEVVRAPRTIMVIYNYADGRWHASSPSLSGFEAHGGSLAETQQAVRADLGDYLDPAVGLDERVWHPWQVTTQVVGVVLAPGMPLAVTVGINGLSVTTAESLQAQGASITSLTGVGINVQTGSNVVTVTGSNVLAVEVPPSAFLNPGHAAAISWPQTQADDRTTVVIAGAPSTVGQTA